MWHYLDGTTRKWELLAHPSIWQKLALFEGWQRSEVTWQGPGPFQSTLQTTCPLWSEGNAAGGNSVPGMSHFITEVFDSPSLEAGHWFLLKQEEYKGLPLCRVCLHPYLFLLLRYYIDCCCHECFSKDNGYTSLMHFPHWKELVKSKFTPLKKNTYMHRRRIWHAISRASRIALMNPMSEISGSAEDA